MNSSNANHEDSPVEETGPTTTFRERMAKLLRMAIQPLLFLLAGLAVLFAIGLAQRIGWLSSGGSAAAPTVAAASVDYICPMMCTPPQKTPGRCPVCAMELVPATNSGDTGDDRSIMVDPATRRVANIRTATVERLALKKTVRAVGEIAYDEGSLKTISAYTDGRFDQLYVDYTGAVVQKGDRLASFYSPQLYSSQVEYLETTAALADRNNRVRIDRTTRRLQASARQRLIEFGMSESQIRDLVQSGKAKSRLDIVAPMHGTVIEKLVVEGDYATEGQPLFRLADLTTVWLVLELFPDDAAAVRYGQAVRALVKSHPSKEFTGRVAFIDPEVDVSSRTVRVRIVLDNQAGLLRIGDYAKAEVTIPLGASPNQQIYDPELANRWISPRHPHIVRDAPGPCPRCGVPLLSATELGFTDQPQVEHTSLVVPRDAVLSAARQAVVYVETEPGRFEIRRVQTGVRSGEYVVIEKGLAEGERVATAGNFLLDSQMQLAGNPSLIDPTRATAPLEMIAGFTAKQLATFEQMDDEERELVIQQVICPVTQMNLGDMGVPQKVRVRGIDVFICCEACREDVLTNPELHLARLEAYRTSAGEPPAISDEFEVPAIQGITPLPSQGDEFEVPEIETITPLPSHGNKFEVPAIEGITPLPSEGDEFAVPEIETLEPAPTADELPKLDVSSAIFDVAPPASIHEHAEGAVR